MSELKRYRPRPAVVEAVRFDGSSTHATALTRWMETGEYTAPGFGTRDVRPLDVPAPDGVREARIGDYVIRDEEGGFRVCGPEEFAATYEEESC